MNKGRSSGVTNMVQTIAPAPQPPPTPPVPPQPQPPQPPAPPTQPTQITSASQAQTIDELRDYAKNVLHIRLSKTLDAIDFETVRTAMTSVETLQADLGVDIGLKRVAAMSLGGAEANTSFTGTVNFDDRKHSPANIARQHRNMANAAANHTFSAGNPGSTFEHELGHIVERALILKAVKSGKMSAFQQAVAWNKSTMAGHIIHNAVNVLKNADRAAGRTPRGINGYISRISSYATTDRSEALAECVADYMAHGNKAHRLSIAVMNEIRTALK